MARRILIAPDKLKGTLTAHAAATCLARGWAEVHREDHLDLLPMSDGGDGFGEVMALLLAAQPRLCGTVDAAHRPCQAQWWWAAEPGTALIESARIVGLAMLPRQQYHPFDLDTQGLAAVLHAAAEAGSTRVLLGIGGSATNDGGFGLARALGWRFLDEKGEIIQQWTQLKKLACVQPAPTPPAVGDVIVAVDVQNPLLGPTGASRIYGPQKGLRPQDLSLAEACLGRLAEVVQHDLGVDVASQPGAGAAGGLGFGLRVCLGARLESGFRLFAHHARLVDRIRAADLVITGEGAIDESTWMGKGVGELGQLCRDNGVPCVGVAGIVAPGPASATSSPPFRAVYAMAPDLTTAEAAIADPQFWLTRLGAEAARRRDEVLAGARL